VSGCAPAGVAETWIVGKSTWGSGETGKQAEGEDPAQGEADRQERGGHRAAVMKGAEMLMPDSATA
jgi:hypothetical protein